jgi:hypothetical protein
LLGIFGNVKGIVGLNIHATDRHLLMLQLSLAEATMIAQTLTNFVKAAGGIDVSTPPAPTIDQRARPTAP